MQAKGSFSRADFIYDEMRDIYTCPAGKASVGQYANGGRRDRRPHKRIVTGMLTIASDLKPLCHEEPYICVSLIYLKEGPRP